MSDNRDEDEEMEDTVHQPADADFVGRLEDDTPFSDRVSIWKCRRCDGMFRHVEPNLLLGMYTIDNSEPSPSGIRRMDAKARRNSALWEQFSLATKCKCPGRPPELPPIAFGWDIDESDK